MKLNAVSGTKNPRFASTRELRSLMDRGSRRCCDLRSRTDRVCRQTQSDENTSCSNKKRSRIPSCKHGEWTPYFLLSLRDHSSDCVWLVTRAYSNSMVPGGLEVRSKNTLLTPLTSLMIRLITVWRTAKGISALSAVMKSMVFTARSATA